MNIIESAVIWICIAALLLTAPVWFTSLMVVNRLRWSDAWSYDGGDKLILWRSYDGSSETVWWTHRSLKGRFTR